MLTRAARKIYTVCLRVLSEPYNNMNYILTMHVRKTHEHLIELINVKCSGTALYASLLSKPAAGGGEEEKTSLCTRGSKYFLKSFSID